MIEPAPPYRGEQRHALWHVSEDPTIERFEPRGGRVWAIDTRHLPLYSTPRSADALPGGPVVWAVDTRHLPLYWFPRDCPRATFWADSTTCDADVAAFLGGDRRRRVHAVEPEWLDAMRTTKVVAYRLPARTFTRWDRFWVSSAAVEPLELVTLGDLVERHADAGIRLETEPDLLALWDRVAASTLDFSGIRLQNARLTA